MSDQKTRYKRLLERIQNHPVAAIILILTVGLIALAQLTGAIEKLWSTIEPEPEIWEASEVRFKYYTLEGHSLSLLLLGELDESLTKIHGDTPLIAENDVYRFLLNIQNKFAYSRNLNSELSSFSSELVEGEGLGLDNARGESRKEIEHSTKLGMLKLLPGTYYSSEYAFTGDARYENQNSLLDDGWSVVFTRTPYVEDNFSSFISNLEEGTIDQYHIEFMKFLSRDEALALWQEDQEWPYLEWLTRENCPQDFFLVRAFQDGCGDGKFIAKLVPYFLKLRVLVIENISKSPVKLSNLSVYLDDNNILRPEIKTQRNIMFEQILADDIMTPDECLIVPLELFLTDKPDSRASWDELEFHNQLDVPLKKTDDLLHQRILNNQSSIRIIGTIWQEREKEFIGIGISFKKTDGQIKIENVIQDTPAFMSGLVVGDVIEAVNGQKIKDMSIENIAKIIGGPVGTKVILTVKRLGKDTSEDITLNRAKITILRGDLVDATVCTISAEKLRKCLAGNQKFKRGDYYIGPSYSPQTIYVNDRKTSIRPRATASLTITHAVHFGSCPYVFARLEDGSVKYCGKLLTGRSAQSKRGWYFKDLPLQITSVLIKEEDQETTYLDAVRITISSNDSVYTILPKDSALHDIDGDIRSIEHGETLYLEFPNLGKIPTEAIRLSAFGYYVPLKSPSAEGMTFHNQ